MGGIPEGGVASKFSPHEFLIEKVQAEHRKEYDVREDRKRELEFLEKGGNPLDFRLHTSVPVSVQSTSFRDPHYDLVICGAKGSNTVTASLHGDSVESCGRHVATVCEPSSADNLMLFDAEHEYSEGDRNSFHPTRGTTFPAGQSIKVDESHKTKEHGDSSAFRPRKSYKRRHRSKSNRDGTRSNCNDVNPAHVCHGSSLPVHTCNRDEKLDDTKSVESTKDLLICASIDVASVAAASENSQDGQNIQLSFVDVTNTTMKNNDGDPAACQVKEKIMFTDAECQPSAITVEVVNQLCSCRTNDFIDKLGDKMINNDQNNYSSFGKNDFDTRSCFKNILNRDAINHAEISCKVTTFDTNGDVDNETTFPQNAVVVGVDFVKQKQEIEVIDNVNIDDLTSATCKFNGKNDSNQHVEGESYQGSLRFQNTLKFQLNEGKYSVCYTGFESMGKPLVMIREDENCCVTVANNGSTNSILDHPVAGSSTKFSAVSKKVQTRAPNLQTSNIDEDSILKEAEIIKAKRKRIAELSCLSVSPVMSAKSHWDYVLEEMTWLANDFAQERLWKLSASSQLCNQAALSYLVRKQGKSTGMVAKLVARTLAKAVIEFWHLVEKTCQEPGGSREKAGIFAIQSYAVRFLKYNNSNVLPTHAEVPLAVDRISDSEILDMSLEDHSTEEILFYLVPHGAMETYTKLIEFHVSNHEMNGSYVETSAHIIADHEYYKAKGDTSPYDVSEASDGFKYSKFRQKKQRQSAHMYGSRTYELGSKLTALPMQFAENKILIHQSSSLAKRPGSSLNVLVPTKRVRTSSRRITSPFSAGTSGFFRGRNKMDASSGDTNSFEDDQSTLHGGATFSNNLDIDSDGEFEKPFPVDSAEVSMKPKKKKKTKHQNSAFDPNWQVDSNFNNVQKDRLRRSSENSQRGSKGYNGMLGQPVMKKIMQKSNEALFDSMPTVAGSVPFPAASQMSNMSHPNKFYKMLSGRERGRKANTLKLMLTPGHGFPWSHFENQVLVVMVNDLGPNWELVSDAFNSILQFKYIFRKARECKKRHSILMERTYGDDADSVDDFGYSQRYPSTLPGIPKGSSRQLLQRLKEAMEEDNLRYHREKIIMIGQKLHNRKSLDPKQLQQPHSSHTTALSQVCPNNLSGGSVLSPLDLCDAICDLDMLSLGYPGAYSSGSTLPNHGTGVPILSASSSAFSGSLNMMLGNSTPSSSFPPNSSLSLPSYSDVRFGLPRSASLPLDEQQRMQQYNQMVLGRNSPRSNVSVPEPLPGIEHGAHSLSGGNGTGMVCVSRSMDVPVFQSVSPSLGNPVSMISPTTHPLAGSSQGNSTVRPHEALQMMRPGLILDSQRQMMSPDLQMHASPGISQGVSLYGGFNSPLPNQMGSQPMTSHPLQHLQSNSLAPKPQDFSPHHPRFQGSANHTPNPQEAYSLRLAKQRQLQHLFLQYQSYKKQQIAASGSSMLQVQPQPHLPVAPSMPSNPQVQSQAISPATSLSPLTSSSSVDALSQQQLNDQRPTQGFSCNAQAGGLTNLKTKQKRGNNRQHPQHRPQSKSLLPSKGVNGGAGGNLTTHPDIPIDHSPSNEVLTESASALIFSAAHQFCQSVDLVTSMHQDVLSQPKLVNQNESAIQKVVRPNLQFSSERSPKAQSHGQDHELNLIDCSSEMDVFASLPPANSSEFFPQTNKGYGKKW